MDLHPVGPAVTLPRRFAPLALAGLVMALGLGLTWQLWHGAERDAAADVQAQFDRRAAEALDQLTGRLTASVHMLRGVQALFASSRQVKRGEFADYVFSHDLERELPGVQGVAYMQALRLAELPAHLARMRAEGFADYAVTPPGGRPFYAPVAYIEPFGSPNLRALGYDAFSDPVRRAMLEQARDSGQAAMSGLIALVQDGMTHKRDGFLIGLPVYRNGAPRLNLAQRRAALVGWVVAPFRITRLLAGIDGGGSVSLGLVDQGAGSVPPRPAGSALRSLRQLSIGGYSWTVVVDAVGTPTGTGDGLRPLAIASTGLTATLVLALLTWLLARSSVRTGRALNQARMLAAELEDGRRQAVALADTAHRAQAMMRSILDSTIEGILVDNGERAVLTSNQRFRTLWGVPGGMDLAGDDQALLEHMVEQLLHPAPFLHRRSLPAPEHGEQRDVLRLKDGRYLEQAASPVRLGTERARLWSFRDITGRKQVEQRDRAHRHVLELLARGAPLGAILDAVVLGVEEGNPGMLCAIMLLDAAGERLLTVSAPSLPVSFNEALNGVPIGPAAGPCGGAAFHGARVIVEDIATHPHWVRYRALARDAGLAACWLEPIRSAPGRVLGSFAIYHRKPHYPSAANIAVIEQAAQLAGIAFERSEAASAVRVSQERFRSLYQNAPVALWEQDWSAVLVECQRLRADGVDDIAAWLRAHPDDAARVAGLVRIGGANGAALEQAGAVGQPGALTLAQNFGIVDDCFSSAVAALAGGALMFACECSFVRLDGELRQNEVTLLVMPGYADTLELVIVSTVDITERKRLDAELLVLATTDFLTGLPNRREFMTRLEEQLARLQRNGDECACVMMLDIDHFKSVNDLHGHATGDAVLRHMAALMREGQRKTDVLGRVGGEEFAVLLAGATPASAQRYAERLRLKVAERPLVHEGRSIAITVSVGLARLHAGDSNCDAALIRADHALYQAKEEGRNRVRRAPEDWADATL